jgi:hypothetical protein
VVSIVEENGSWGGGVPLSVVYIPEGPVASLLN